MNAKLSAAAVLAAALALTTAAQAPAWAAAAIGVTPAQNAAQAAAAQVFRFNESLAKTTAVIGLTGPAIGYEDRVPEGKVLEAQYAILHALMGFSGHYGDSAAAEQQLLRSMDLQVTPLTGADHAILDHELGEVRHDRNGGIPKTDTHRTISLQSMAERHRALIRAHAGAIKALARGTLSSGSGSATTPTPAGRATPAAPTPRQQYDRVLDLINPIKDIRAAGTPKQLAEAVARFNAAAAAFGRGYSVTATQPGEALRQAVAIYDAERSAAASMGAILPDNAVLALPDSSTLASKAQLDARFDGAAGGSTIPGGLGGVRFSPSRGGDGSELTQNAPAWRHGHEPPAPKDEAGGGGMGLFGFLGLFFKAVLRTAVRVVSAAFNGAVGVTKALFS